MFQSTTNKLLYIGCASVVLFFFLLNVYTPLISDDFVSPPSAISDILKFLSYHYQNTGGRCVAYLFSQLSLFVGKPIFNVINTAVYCAFILLVIFHITGKRNVFNPLLFLILSATFWFLVPAWGQNFLWLSGSTNYLWTTTLVLFFLIPFRLNYDNNTWKLNIPMSGLYFFLGILAGWSNENTGAAILVLLIAYFSYKIITKKKFYAFEILGFLGCLIGFIMLISAPGNFTRLDIFRANDWGNVNYPMLSMLVSRFISVTRVFVMNYGALLFGVLIFLAHIIRHRKKQKLHVFAYLYALAAVVGTYSMVLSPIFPERAFFSVIVFLVIALGHTLYQTNVKIPDIVKRNRWLIVFVMIYLSSISIIHSTKDIVRVYLLWSDRIEQIYAEKNNGNFDVEVAPIYSQNRHTALFGITYWDLNKNPNISPNTHIAERFGINTIVRNDNLQKEISLRKNIRRVIFPRWMFRFP